MKADALRFLDFVRGRCAEHRYRLCLELSQCTKDGDIGYLDDANRVLFVCMDRSGWAPTVAHELGHMEQNAEGMRSTWDTHHFERWVAGKVEFPDEKILKITRNIQKFELDAERRAIKLIRQFRLCDAANYTRRANLYVLGHEVVRRKRAWWSLVPGTSPLGRPEVQALAPSRLIPLSRIGHVSKEIEEALIPTIAPNLDKPDGLP